MNIERPSSPSATMVAPASKTRSTSIDIRTSRLASGRPPKKGVATRNVFRSGELTAIGRIYSRARGLAAPCRGPRPRRPRQAPGRRQTGGGDTLERTRGSQRARPIAPALDEWISSLCLWTVHPVGPCRHRYENREKDLHHACTMLAFAGRRPLPKRLGRCIRTQGIAMTYRISYRRHLTGAAALAALVVNVPMATAQPTQPPSRMISGMDDAIKALDNFPRLKN